MTGRRLSTSAYYPPISDGLTIWRIWEAHEPMRAVAIIAGWDLRTSIDIRKWHSLGRAK